MDPRQRRLPPIITVGSGAVENILAHHGDIQLGKKHQVKFYEALGGSCVNYSLRLLNTGNCVFPIPFIGADPNGSIIRREFIRLACEQDLPEPAKAFIRSDDFFFPNIQTPRTTIIVHRGHRTIFSQKLKWKKDTEKHLQKRLDGLNDLIPGKSGSIMIGHIAMDGDVQNPGRLTKKMIHAYHSGFLIVANMGNSQLKHGIDFWKNDLKHVDLFQLNLGEIRTLFKQGRRHRRLYEIVNWLRRHAMTSVITLNRFGAIGTYKNGKEGILLARPLDVESIVDPTGAGDAFAAGMVSSLQGKKDFTFQDFKAAVIEGRLWGSYACTTLGASCRCPDRNALDAYRSKTSKLSGEILEIKTAAHAEQTMDLIDTAY